MSTAIEWTDETWNPTTGCTKISPGCAHCYIERTPPMRMAGRKFVKGKIPIQLHADRLTKPLHWRTPRMVFVNSMSDLFHEDVPDEFIRRVFAVMSLAGQHTFQVLTKRADRLEAWFADPANSLSACQAEFCVKHGDHSHRIYDSRAINGTHGQAVGDGNYWPLPNVWLGVSVEDRSRYKRVHHLLRTPAAVRFLSIEPLLEDLGDLRMEDCWLPERIGWIIVGGESGPGARPMHPDWARSIRDQCQAAGVPFFFKQWGDWVGSDSEVAKNWPTSHSVSVERGHVHVWPFKKPSGPPFFGMNFNLRVGKKSAGRTLDGRTWDEMPGTATK